MSDLKINVFLDTSVINFLFADDAPEKRDVTVEYFAKYVKTNKYHHLVSEFVVEEISKTSNIEQRTKLLNVIEEYDISVPEIENGDEILELAEKYIKGGILSQNSLYDSLHVAFCTVNKIDLLLSWNFKHLSNFNKERLFQIKNLELGYLFTPRLYNPMEAFNE